MAGLMPIAAGIIVTAISVALGGLILEMILQTLARVLRDTGEAPVPVRRARAFRFGRRAEVFDFTGKAA